MQAKRGIPYPCARALAGSSVLFTLILASCTHSVAPDPITAREVQAHVDFLASDELAGRDAGYPGAETAARYIATQFESLGLSQVGEDWEMEFELRGAAKAGAAAIELGEQRFGGSSLVDATRFSALGDASGRPVVEDGQIEGNIVVVDGWTNKRDAKAKAKELVADGATGVCFVANDPWLKDVARAGDFRRMGGKRSPLEMLAGEPDGEGIHGEVSNLDDLPEGIREMLEEQLAAMGVEPGAAQLKIVTSAGDLPEGAFDGDGAKMEMKIGGPEFLFGGSRLEAPVLRVSRPVGDALLAAVEDGGELTVRVPAIGRNMSTNVLGLIEGSDPVLKDEYVVVGGHYDHTGADEDGNIWNGADDNASGTAGVLEIAETLASMEIKPRRSILLAAWGAEERGLVGSRAFGANPPIPKDKITAYVNLDMISRGDAGAVTILSASDDLKQWAQEAAAAHGMEPQKGSAFFLNASDTAPFVSSEIATVFFFAGMHSDYHRPTDDPDTIDADKAARVARAALDVVVRAANADERPKFTKPEMKGFGMFNLAGGKRRLGIFPTTEAEGEGVGVFRVVPDSVAMRAGIQVGDRIVRISETPIRKARDIGEALESVDAGKAFEIEIRRSGDGDEQTLVLHGVIEED